VQRPLIDFDAGFSALGHGLVWMVEIYAGLLGSQGFG
jgi:hypothetical protein